ncbi:hypothetical protein [Arenicella xantha]|uniref:Uncharacterized protein n=1 Tax=Arenicella xantha TaxID=644221 RepID=A0A395JGP9_9GAMM|nr:hypothetical protein [Arenicella xantha]RBP45003.1 hypothetical protein DFR28_1203 [Arenicella xantha]
MNIAAFITLLFISSFAWASDTPCNISTEKGFTEHLGNQNFDLEKIIEPNGNYSFSLTVDNHLDSLPIENIGLVRHVDGKVVLGASLEMHRSKESVVTHVVGIPREAVTSYKFYISYSEQLKNCPNVKSFYVSFGT